MLVEITCFYDCTIFSLPQKSCILKVALGKEEIMDTIAQRGARGSVVG
jgi:hypothetical protein